MKEFLIGASRGRNPNNPSDRTPGIPTIQRLEINKEGICNTLTTVLKDNYVIEIYSKKKGVTMDNDFLEKVEKMAESILCRNCEIKDIEDKAEGCSGCLVFRNFRDMLLNGYID